MTDTREALAEAFLPYAQSDNQSYDMADLAMQTIIARIPPLVWRQGDECFKADSPFGRYGLSDGGGSIAIVRLKGSIIARVSWDNAKAAANAHHVAQLCKGMGIE